MCQNGGTCTNDNSGGYYCTCPSGFSGVYCQNAGNLHTLLKFLILFATDLI